jgi:hypothetical protein
MGEDDDWLHGAKVICPSCGQALWRVDHSPFYDEDFLYCDQCPMHVEVSFYDPVYDALARDFPRGNVASLRAVEARLKPCTCGGTFRYDAARRCLTCHAPVIVENPAGINLAFWADLYPSSDGSNWTDERMKAEERRHAPFTSTEDLWRGT